MKNLVKKSIALLLTTVFFFNMALASSATIGNVVEVEKITNSDEVLEEEAVTLVVAAVVAGSVVATFAVGIAVGYFANGDGGYQDDLNAIEDANYDELDFAKFDVE